MASAAPGPLVGGLKAKHPVFAHVEAGDLAAIQAINEADLPKALRARDDDSRTALHWACSGGHKEVAEFLLSKGAEVTVEDDEGWTPLHSCASRGDGILLDLLLEKKADPDAATSSKTTALHFAASKGHADVVTMLLAAGAKKNPRDRYGGTPLMRAAGQGRTEVLKTLLAASVDVAAKDKAGDNAFHIVINGQHMEACEILMSCDNAEAIMMQQNEDKKTPADLILGTWPMEVRDTLKSIWRKIHGGGDHES
eukprot:gnl/TRDRNA2_/TRDRNA2_184440_c0_seq1.p1 gnl/TRDRNA2_/TRDRNA2_184440_c0~~gnl/TRDRNA2_/TRDRNA2_184440_c0_seq1.p1  ORF type:complete len:253 (+),score=62.40 gnl/TRDRNA2_/TRDRNA2_184440_c0_seq1:136-894(+)